MSSMDSIWDDDPNHQIPAEAEWSRLTNEFTNAGYREGITAGKESSVQGGFDEGFATVGAPIGRQIGLLRGYTSALLSSLTYSGKISTPTADGDATSRLENVDQVIADVKDIASRLGKIQFADITPVDHEAVAHAREHLDSEGDGQRIDEIQRQDISNALKASREDTKNDKPTQEDVKALQEKLMELCKSVGIEARGFGAV